MRLKRQEDRVWGMILISLLVIKISSEAHGIRLPQPGAELRTVPLGHQLGAFMGLVSGLVWPWKYIFKQPLVASKN